MKWLRLDISWSTSDWLCVLSAEARLAWVELLCYVKAYGTAGRARAKSPEAFARMIYVGEESIRQLLKAAEMHGALSVVEGDWIIVKWREYQCDENNANRQARFRENQKSRSDAPESNGSNALRPLRNGSNDYVDVDVDVDVDKKHSKKNACEAPFISESVAMVVSYLNERAGRKFDPSAGNCNQLRARVRDAGAKDAAEFVADAMRVIDLKVGEWSGDAKMSKFLRPETLFNSEKWPTYLEASSRGSNGRHLMTPEEIEQAARDLK